MQSQRKELEKTIKELDETIEQRLEGISLVEFLYYGIYYFILFNFIGFRVMIYKKTKTF